MYVCVWGGVWVEGGRWVSVYVFVCVHVCTHDGTKIVCNRTNVRMTDRVTLTLSQRDLFKFGTPKVKLVM